MATPRDIAGGRHEKGRFRGLGSEVVRVLDRGVWVGLQDLGDDAVGGALRSTDLQKAGVPINVAKELMGHADIQTTANIYTHKDTKTAHTGIAMLDGTLKKKKK